MLSFSVQCDDIQSASRAWAPIHLEILEISLIRSINRVRFFNIATVHDVIQIRNRKILVEFGSWRRGIRPVRKLFNCDSPQVFVACETGLP